MAEGNFKFTFEIRKVDPEKRHVFGFLSVAANSDGTLVVDRQGDYIRPETLEKTAKDFMLSSRTAGEMHDRVGVGQIFESMLFTPDKLGAIEKACELPDGYLSGRLPTAWWIGAEVNSDDGAWDRVKSGELKAWSVGGSGRRV